MIDLHLDAIYFNVSIIIDHIYFTRLICHLNIFLKINHEQNFCTAQNLECVSDIVTVKFVVDL